MEKIQQKHLLDSIWRACEEFSAVLPKDLLKGAPPRRMGHEFKINLEPVTTPIHRPIYKLSPPELEKARTQIDSMLKHGFIRPSLLCPRRAVQRRPVLWAERDTQEQNPQVKDYIISRQNRLNAPGYIARAWAHYNAFRGAPFPRGNVTE